MWGNKDTQQINLDKKLVESSGESFLSWAWVERHSDVKDAPISLFEVRMKHMCLRCVQTFFYANNWQSFNYFHLPHLNRPQQGCFCLFGDPMQHAVWGTPVCQTTMDRFQTLYNDPQRCNSLLHFKRKTGLSHENLSQIKIKHLELTHTSKFNW